MGIANTAIMAGWLGFGAAVVVGCGRGGGGLLSGDQANNLKSQLDAVSTEASSGQCTAVQGTIAQLHTTLADYPSINPTLVLSLDQDFNEVARLAAIKCHQAAPFSTLPTRTTPSHPKQTNTVSTSSTATAPPATATVTTTTTTSTSTTPTTSSTTQTTTNGGVGIGGGTGTSTNGVPGGTTTTTPPAPGSTGGAGSGAGGTGAGQ